MTTVTRAELIRRLLRGKPEHLFTLREIGDATSPGVALTSVSGSVSTLIRSGHVERVLKQNGSARYRYPVDRSAGQPRAEKSAPPPPSAALRAAVSGLARPTGAINAREQPTNFLAPINTVVTSHCPNRRAANVIAADVAEFERRGGRIEKLGITKTFHHPAYAADENN